MTCDDDLCDHVLQQVLPCLLVLLRLLTSERQAVTVQSRSATVACHCLVVCMISVGMPESAIWRLAGRIPEDTPYVLHAYVCYQLYLI